MEAGRQDGCLNPKAILESQDHICIFDQQAYLWTMLAACPKAYLVMSNLHIYF